MDSCSTTDSETSTYIDKHVEHALKHHRTSSRSFLCRMRPRRMCRWMLLQVAILALYVAAFFAINSDMTLVTLEGRSVSAAGQLPLGDKPLDNAAQANNGDPPAETKNDAPADPVQVQPQPKEDHKAVMPNAPAVEKEIKDTKKVAAAKEHKKPVKAAAKSSHGLPPEILMKPVAKNVQKVLLFTYMRGGSSFLGQMFDKNPDAMYLFEPLDGAYSSMYGVPLLVPSLDVTHFVNRTKRIYSSAEVDFIADSVYNILSCKMGLLPTEILIHPFVYRKVKSKSFGYYGDCLAAEGIESFRWKCVPFKPTCDKRPAGSKPIRCELLGNDLVRLANQEPKQEYWDCLKKLRTASMKCVPLMEAECKRTSLRALKSVRLTGGIIKRILEKYKDVKILYYLRDPRGIVPSRKKEDILSINSEKDWFNEIEMLAQDMTADIKLMYSLNRKYPKRIKFEYYENFAQASEQVAKDAYKFVGVDMPAVVAEHLYNITHASSNTAAYETARSNATATAYAWRTSLPADVIQKMNSLIGPFFKAAKLITKNYKP